MMRMGRLANLSIKNSRYFRGSRPFAIAVWMTVKKYPFATAPLMLWENNQFLRPKAGILIACSAELLLMLKPA